VEAQKSPGFASEQNKVVFESTKKQLSAYPGGTLIVIRSKRNGCGNRTQKSVLDFASQRSCQRQELTASKSSEAVAKNTRRKTAAGYLVTVSVYVVVKGVSECEDPVHDASV